MYKDLFPDKKRWINDTVSDDGYPFPDNRHKGKKNNNNNNNNNNDNNNNNNDNDNDNNNNSNNNKENHKVLFWQNPLSPSVDWSTKSWKLKSHALLRFVLTISIFLVIINSASNTLYINQLKMTVVSVKTCLSKLKSCHWIFFKFLTCLLLSRPFGIIIYNNLIVIINTNNIYAGWPFQL